MTNAKTNFGTAIETASAAFGPAFVAKVLAMSNANTKTFYAFFDSMIEAQPLAVAVGYSIISAIENANDTPERDWDEVFGATLSSWFDDLDMLFSSGLDWRLSQDSFKVFADAIRAYDKTGIADTSTTLDFAKLGAFVSHKRALDAYKEAPNKWMLEDLLESANVLFDLEEKSDLAFFKKIEAANANKGCIK